MLHSTLWFLYDIDRLFFLIKKPAWAVVATYLHYKDIFGVYIYGDSNIMGPNQFILYLYITFEQPLTLSSPNGVHIFSWLAWLQREICLCINVNFLF